MGSRSFRSRLTLVTALLATLVALVAAAPSGAYTVNYTREANDLRDNPCTPGDLINFDGLLHMVLHVTADNRGGYHVGMESNWRGSGLSLVTGVEYRGEQTTYDSVYIGTGETVTWIDSVHLISQADAEDFLSHATIHLRVTPAGVPAVTIGNTWFECKG